MIAEVFKILDLDVSIITELEDEEMMKMVSYAMNKADLKFVTYIVEDTDDRRR